MVLVGGVLRININDNVLIFGSNGSVSASGPSGDANKTYQKMMSIRDLTNRELYLKSLYYSINKLFIPSQADGFSFPLFSIS